MSSLLNTDLDPSIDQYAVLGHPVRHSKSPQIHALFATQTGQCLAYQAIDLAPEAFQQGLMQFQHAGGKGVNITVPFKEEAYKGCHCLSDRARQAGSVNTIWFDRHGQACGDTTDGIGLINDLRHNLRLDLADKTVLILGAGGAVRGILPAIAQCLPAHVVIANRTLRRAQDLVADHQGRAAIRVSDFAALSGTRFDLIINGSSASLLGQLPPLPDDLLEADGACYDLMYADEPTPFVRWGREHGARVSVDGLGMLVEQAAESFYLWRGVRPDTRAVLQHLTSEEYDKD